MRKNVFLHEDPVMCGLVFRLRKGAEGLFKNHPSLRWYFGISIKYIAPLIIVIVMLDALGVF
jgi:hypothetical protein